MAKPHFNSERQWKKNCQKTKKKKGPHLKKKILITGALGLIGQQLIKYDLKDFDIIAVDIKKPEESSEESLEKAKTNTQFFKVDLGDPQSIQSFWKQIEKYHKDIESVIHLAAYYDYSNKPNPQYFKIQQGLQTLLKLFEKDLPKKCSFIYASSLASFRPTKPGHPLTESSQRSLSWEYAKSKVFNEAIIDNFKSKKIKIHLILAAVYSDFCEFVPLYHSIERLRSHSLKSYFYPAPFKRGLTYVHLSDVGEAFSKAISFAKKEEPLQLAQKGKKTNYRFFIGEERAFTYEDIHRKVTLYFGKKIKVLFRIPQFVASLAYLLLWPFKIFQ